MNRTLLKYELLTLLRDTRTIFLSVLLPIILLPVLLFTLNRFGRHAHGDFDDTYHYSRAFPNGGLKMVTQASFDQSVFREVVANNGQQMLSEGSLDILLQVRKPDVVDAKVGQDIVEMFPGLKSLVSEKTPGQPIIEILYRSDREKSVRAFLKASDQLELFRERLFRLYLERQGVELGIKISPQDASTPQERAARHYGPALSAFMVLMLLGGGSVAALDSLAGERERGTLSTLFVSSMDRRSIALTKFTAVAIISVAVALLQILNLAGYLALGIVQLPLGANWAGLLALFAIFVSEAILTASLLLYISARCNSFKEAQLFFFPAFLVAFALSLAGLMPALVSRSVVSLIPLTGPAVLIPEILAGRLDLAMLILQCGVHVFFARLLLRSTMEHMDRESFLGGQKPLHGDALRFAEFSQRALPFFAFLGAALFVIPSNFEVLSGLKGQVIFNQIVLFGLGPYLLVKYYGRDLSQVVPLRGVDWKIFVICLLLIPLGQFAATGLSHLVGPLLPAPVKALEMLMEMLDLENTPGWQLYLLIGVMPGIFEEFAFRGVLLHALHKRFSPWTLAFVVALVFGFFHVNFFRVLPTAYLGFIMALLTLATGSIIPGVIVHIGNNSLAVWAMTHQIDFEGMPEWVYLLGFVAQIGLVYLVLRWGKGYPGTRWEKWPEA